MRSKTTLDPTDFHYMDKKTKIVFKILSLMFHRRKNIIQVGHIMGVSK